MERSAGLRPASPAPSPAQASQFLSPGQSNTRTLLYSSPGYYQVSIVLWGNIPVMSWRASEDNNS